MHLMWTMYLKTMESKTAFANFKFTPNNHFDMKKKMQSQKLSLSKKAIVSLNARESRQVQGGVNTNANCPPSVGCTKYQPCVTCNCPDW